MKIHLVTQEFNNESILARLAHILVDQGGFTVGDTPRPDVDLNYFFPYLFWDWNVPSYSETLTAAWFTHRDPSLSEHKAMVWDQVAQATDMRLSSAHKYEKELLRFGESHYVTPPLDMEKFYPSPLRERRMRPRVGVAGFVYQGGRKGERLVESLTQSQRGWDIVAAGRGWPCPTQFYPWEILQTFYQGLDVFLCTSLVEGVGYPPMEALACGVPVVIPFDVGLFDDLPNIPGIYRYPAGNFEAMQIALQTALDTAHNVNDLRGSVAGFTVQKWLDDHFRIFGNMVFDPVPLYQASWDWQPKAGVIYFAYGKPARDCAVDALASWHRHMNPLPAALVSDEPLGSEDVFIPFEDHDIGARWAKTKIYDLAPKEWEYVLYLDADTEIVADVRLFYQILADGWEFVICKNPDKYHTTRRMVRPDNGDECSATFEVMGTDDALQWNGGVFAFRRCPRTEAFFKLWHEEWQRWGKRDQAALLRAMWRSPLRVYTLGNEWNTVTRYVDPNSTAGILHYPTTARRHIGTVQGRLDSAEAWSKVRKLN